MFPTKIIFLHENFMFKNKEKGKGFEKSSECEKSRRRWWKSLVKVPWRQFAVAFGRNFLKVFFFVSPLIQFNSFVCSVLCQPIVFVRLISSDLFYQSAPNLLHFSSTILFISVMFCWLWPSFFFGWFFHFLNFKNFLQQISLSIFFFFVDSSYCEIPPVLTVHCYCECSRRGKKVLFSLPNILHLYENMLELQRSPSSSGLFRGEENVCWDWILDFSACVIKFALMKS